MKFNLSATYRPTGDQPEAIEQIVDSIIRGDSCSTLRGVTGSGKTFTMANVVEQINRPTLVLCHNKTLAAQLYSEFKNFFPDNAVEYYVSYYDYYQPEAYLPTTGTYIEKDLSINDEIEKMRISTTSTLLSGRRDVIVVSSVSCIYGIGNPEDFKKASIHLAVGSRVNLKHLLYALVEALYVRTERELSTATFRINGESIDIMSAYGDQCYRVSMFDDEIESIRQIDPTSGRTIISLDEITISPANLFVTNKERIGEAIGQIYVDMGGQAEAFERSERLIEANRLRQRVEYDLEMIKELGYCSGIENYSRYFDGRKAGQPPFCLLNYFPEDYLMIIDESHITVPQIRGMFGGDRARKDNLIEYGFRLEAARDNRPLNFEEFEKLLNVTLFVSATPADYEMERSEYNIIEQLIRPTGLVDPTMELRPLEYEVDNLTEEIRQRVARGEKILVATITKRMAEELSKYYDRIGIRNRYIHSDIDTLERVQILDDLRADLYDVIIGVNLLREGIDLPEIGLAAILDGDKEGFLRNTRSLTQIGGRAARHTKGGVIIYCNKLTNSIRESVMISNRQRLVQALYNLEHKQLPMQAKKSGSTNSHLLNSGEGVERSGHDIAYYTPAESKTRKAAEPQVRYTAKPNKQATPQGSIDQQIADAKSAMEAAAKKQDFDAAIKYRDIMVELTKERDKLRLSKLK
ncbi:MAG: excinuclease ABC subunit UvrB [Rikenellaceae bacterium]